MAVKRKTKAVPLPLPEIEGADLEPWSKMMRWLLLGVAAALVLWQYKVRILDQASELNGGILFAATVSAFGFLSVAGAVWARGQVSVLSPDRVLAGFAVPWLLVKGAMISSAVLFSTDAMPYYVLAALAYIYAVYAPFWPRTGPSPDLRSPWRALYLILITFAVAGLVLWIRDFSFKNLAVKDDKNSLVLLFFSRVTGNATDISGTPFRNWGLLTWPVLYFALVAGLTWRYWTKGLQGTRHQLWLLVFLAVAGKLVIAGLSSQGLDVIGLKITSVNTNYYTLSERISEIGLWSYLKDYQSIQGTLGAHGATHPPGPMVFYWLLGNAVAHKPALIGFGVMVIAALTVFPVFRLAEIAFGNARAGLVAALLYLCSPMSLILSGAGIDSLVLMLMAWSMLLLVRAARERRPWLAVASGAVFFALSLVTFGAVAVLMFSFLFAAWAAREREETLFSWLGWLGAHLALFGLTLVALHLLYYVLLGGSYNYLKSFSSATFTHISTNFYRPYGLWAWANVVLYLPYAGVGVVAAWLYETFRALWAGRERPESTMALLALPMILTLIFSAMGRAEVNRIFIFAVLFVVLPATGACLDKNPRLERAITLSLAGLSFAGAVVLQIFVLDFW